MDRRQPLVYNLVGQEVELYRTDWPEGAVSGGMTAKVWRALQGNDETPVLTPTVTVEAIALAIDAASGFSQTNRRKLNMTSTAGIVQGRRYYTQNGDGQRELVEIAHISANAFVETEYDLAYDYGPAGATLNGLRASFVIDPTFIATLGNINLKGYISRQGWYPDYIDLATGLPYRVLWSYTVASSPRQHWTYFDVVRGRAQHGVLGDDLFDLFPDLAYQESRGQRGEKFKRYLDAGERRVAFDLRVKKYDPNQIADHLYDDLVRDATLLLIAESGKAPPGRDLEVYVRERYKVYANHLDGLITGPVITMSQNTAGSLTPDPEPTLFFK